MKPNITCLSGVNAGLSVNAATLAPSCRCCPIIGGLDFGLMTDYRTLLQNNIKDVNVSHLGNGSIKAQPDQGSFPNYVIQIWTKFNPHPYLQPP